MIPGIVVYLEDLELFDENLDDAEIGKLVRGLANYAKTGRGIENLSPVGKIAYKIMKVKVDREIESYNKKVAGSRQRWEQQRQSDDTSVKDSNPKECTAKDSIPKDSIGTQKEKEKENENENEDEKENEKRVTQERNTRTGGGFEPPTLDQVRDYVSARRLKMDPEAFFVHYKARGWMMGAAQMVDWESACEGWAKHEKPDSGGKPNLRVLSSNFSGQRDLSEDQMRGTTDDDILAAIMEQRKKVSG